MEIIKYSSDEWKMSELLNQHQNVHEYPVAWLRDADEGAGLAAVPQEVAYVRKTRVRAQ